MNTSASSLSPQTPKVGRQPQPQKEVSANIQVVCRLRPLAAHERESPVAVHTAGDRTVQIDDKESSPQFTFDHVCDSAASQAEVYELVGKAALTGFFEGFNSTILAYGQTGAGKSYTMFGERGDRVGDQAGLIPRIAEHIFEHISTGSADVEYTVGVSLMEIYKEQILDMLDPRPRDFSIQQDPVDGVFVKGLSHAFVSSASELAQVFEQGNQQRKRASTAANPESSRSHAIFQVTLSQRNTESGELRKSNLFLVDLAGSEKVDRTGAVGNSLEEAKKINKSLSALGLVITSLTDQRATHIPYRDSKLTRILQESLGGNSRTTLIVNVSPSTLDVSETLSTLRFGSRAKKIRNKVHINTELSVEQLKARVAQLERTNQELENELKGKKMLGLSSPLATPSRIPPVSAHMEEMARKNEKIAQLEAEVMQLKMASLRVSHDEDSKLLQLEDALYKISDKLADVEVINENLRKHLATSERVIAARDDKINRLYAVVHEQQVQVSRESSHFESKLRVLKSKLDAQRFREDSRVADEMAEEMESSGASSRSSFHEDMESFEAPQSPKLGLNLRIVKPVRGGQPPESGETK